MLDLQGVSRNSLLAGARTEWDLNGVEWSRFESFRAKNLKKLSKPVLYLFEIIAEEMARLYRE
jgi:hypothetical protein